MRGRPLENRFSSETLEVYRDDVRAAAVAGLEELGIVLDPEANKKAIRVEAKISAPNSRVQIWVIPTNEEIIVGRQTKELLTSGK